MVPNPENPNLVFDKVLWESGLSPALFTCGKTLGLSELVTTLGSFFDPLSKEAAEFYGNATHYPTNNLSIDKTAMKIFGFGRSEITRSNYVNGKWNYDITVGCGEECNFDNPPPECNDTQDSNFETYSQTGNKMKKQKLTQSSTSTIEKIKYIVGKEWGDKLQVIIYFMMILYDESVVMATGDMVVFTLCLVLKIPCFYTSVKQNKIDSLFPQVDPKNITRIIYYAGEGGERSRYIKSAEKTIRDIQENNARIIVEYRAMTEFAKGNIRIKTGTNQGDRPGQSGIHIDYDTNADADTTLGQRLFESMLIDVTNIDSTFPEWKNGIEGIILTMNTDPTNDELLSTLKTQLQEADKYTLKSIFKSFEKKIINRVSSYTENEDDTSKPEVIKLVDKLKPYLESENFIAVLGEKKIRALNNEDFHKKKFHHIITTLLCESNSKTLNRFVALQLPDEEEAAALAAAATAAEEAVASATAAEEAVASAMVEMEQDNPGDAVISPLEDDEDAGSVKPEYVERPTSYIHVVGEDILPEGILPEGNNISENKQDIYTNDDDDEDSDVLDGIFLKDTKASILKTTTTLSSENGEIKVLKAKETSNPSQLTAHVEASGGSYKGGSNTQNKSGPERNNSTAMRRRRRQSLFHPYARINTKKLDTPTLYVCYVNLDRVLISRIYYVFKQIKKAEMSEDDDTEITIKELKNAINLYYDDSNTNKCNVMPGIRILDDDESYDTHNAEFDEYIKSLLNNQTASGNAQDQGQAEEVGHQKATGMYDYPPGTPLSVGDIDHMELNNIHNALPYPPPVGLGFGGGAKKTRKKPKSSQLRKTLKKRRVKKIKRKSLRRKKPIKKRVNSKNRKVKRKIKNKTRKYKKPKKQKRSRKPNPKP